MKKLLALFLAPILLLTACGNSAEASFVRFVSSVSACEALSFTADIRAEYKTRSVNFTLKYSQDDDGAVIEAVKPEIISGVKARVADDGVSLEYDGAILALGELKGEGEVSPLSAVPTLIKAMREGHIELAWNEDELLAARLIPADGVAVDLRLDSELVPVFAEISYGENTAVFIDITDWMMT